MNAQALTNLLTTGLITSIIILFVLIIVFVIIAMKEKKKQKEEEEPKEITKATPTKVTSNIIQTKSYTTENIKKFMDFTDIKDNMIIQKDGKRLVMVIQCQGINYDLMSSIEKDGVEQGFSQFLNTLTKPIQLHIQARKVNLEESLIDYKKRLSNIESNFRKITMQYAQIQNKKETNPEAFKKVKMEYVRQKNLYEYTKDIIENTEKLSLNQNILTKNYYIAISYYPENNDGLFQKEEVLEMAFSELYTNAQAILRTLAVCGVTGKVLNSVELAELLYVAYNRDSSEIYDVDKAIKSGYDALYTTAPDVINKKMATLDKIIDEKAFVMANLAINKVVQKSRREKELEQREKEMDELIKEMAKEMLKESEELFSQEIVEKSIEEIENMHQNKKETKNKKEKKGA